MPTMQFLSVKYIAERSRQGRFNGTTPRTIRSVLDQFCELAGPGAEPTVLTRRHYERWIEREHLAIGTRRNHLSVVMAFTDWMVEHHYLKRNPGVGVKGPRQPRKVPLSVVRDDVRKLLVSLPDVRAEVIVLLMVEEGLRCREVTALEIGDVVLEEGRIIVHGKGGHMRELPLCEETASAVRRYLGEYPAPGGPLVRSYHRQHKALSPGYISGRMAVWMADAGLRPLKTGAQRGRVISAHSLRHSCARDLVATGANLRDVQSVLGHQSLQTTGIYVGFSPLGDLRKVMEGRDYKQRKTAKSTTVSS